MHLPHLKQKCEHFLDILTFFSGDLMLFLGTDEEYVFGPSS